MDPKNFVGRTPTGFDVYVGGQKVGSYTSQQDAEQHYNTAVSGAATAALSGAGGPAGPGVRSYQTRTGVLTPEEMLSQLDSAAGGHWDGDRVNPDAVFAAYQNVNTSGGGSGYPTTGQKGFDAAAADVAERQANDAATQEYQRMRLNLLEIPQMQAQTQAQRDQLALQSARDVWDKTYQQSLLSGQYNGAPTEAAKEYQQNYGLQQAGVTGIYNGAPTEAAREYNTSTGLDYLKLLASQRGPANAFQYARTLSQTPRGFGDIVNAAAGQYTLSGFGGTSGEQPVPASGANLLQDAQNATSANPRPLTVSTAAPSGIDPRIGAGAVPLYDAGGVIPGRPGSHELAMLEAGERVVPPPSGRGRSGVVMVNGRPLPLYDAGTDASGAVVARRGDTGGAVGTGRAGDTGGAVPMPAPAYQPPASVPSTAAVPYGSWAVGAPSGQMEHFPTVTHGATGDTGGAVVAPRGPLSTPVGDTGGAIPYRTPVPVGATGDTGATPIPARPLPANPPTVTPTAAVPYGSWAGTTGDTGGATPAAPAPAATPAVTPAATPTTQLPLPSQWNAANWLRMSPSQKALLQSAYEAAGWDWNDVMFAFQQSLPAYSGPTTGHIGL